MTKYPLFGQDSVPQYTSRILSIVGTAVFWLIFLIVMICIKPVPKKPKYKEVQIVLSQVPQNLKQPEPVQAPEPAESAMKSDVKEEFQPEIITEPVTKSEPVEKEVSKPEVKQKQEPAPKVETVKQTVPKEQPKKAVENPPKPKTEPKKEVIKTDKTESKSKTQPVMQPEPTFTGEYVDPMEAFEAQTSKSKKKDFDWSAFDDISDSESDKSNEPVEKYVAKKPAESSFSGNAGEVKNSTTQKSTTSSTNSNNTKTTTKGTNTALADIENTKGKTNTATEGKAVESNAAVTTDSNSNLKWSNGASRKMIMPKNPKLDVSKENQSKVNYSEVGITFTVNADGYVSRSSISTNPPISQSVLDEISEQIAEWWFSPGEGNATATLIWRIQRN